jgi:hypothetical protein
LEGFPDGLLDGTALGDPDSPVPDGWLEGFADGLLDGSAVLVGPVGKGLVEGGALGSKDGKGDGFGLGSLQPFFPPLLPLPMFTSSCSK